MMIVKYFKPLDKGIQEVDMPSSFKWINIVADEIKELDEIINKYSLPRDFLVDIFDADEVARSETNPPWYCYIIKISVEDPRDDIPYKTIPMGIMISENLIISISSKNSTVIDDLTQKISQKIDLNDVANFMLHLFSRNANSFLQYLRTINRETRRLEQSLLKSMENKEIIQLLRLQKSLVYFTTALKSNEIMIDKLQKDKFSNLKPANQDLLEDLLIENKQTMEMAVIYSEILTGLMDAFASIISNNLNVVMKFLTSLTILLTIPMLIVSVFGMNIPLPLTTSKYALGIIGLIALLSMGVGIYYFRKQKYL